MAVVREFYRRRRPGETESFALARDVMTDQLFVVHSRGHSEPNLVHTEKQMSVREFLQGEGSEQTALLDLIGTLVVEE